MLVGCGGPGEEPPTPQPKIPECTDAGEGVINCGEDQYMVRRVYHGINGPAEVDDIRAATSLLNKVRGINVQNSEQANPAPVTTTR